MTSQIIDIPEGETVVTRSIAEQITNTIVEYALEAGLIPVDSLAHGAGEPGRMGLDFELGAFVTAAEGRLVLLRIPGASDDYLLRVNNGKLEYIKQRVAISRLTRLEFLKRGR